MDLDGYLNDKVGTVPKPCVAYPSRLRCLLRMKNTSIYSYTHSPSAIKAYTAASYLDDDKDAYFISVHLLVDYTRSTASSVTVMTRSSELCE